LRLFRGNTGIGIEEQSTCFVMRDHNGQQLAYVYFEDERQATHQRRGAAGVQ
jgi:hypothetical protein